MQDLVLTGDEYADFEFPVLDRSQHYIEGSFPAFTFLRLNRVTPAGDAPTSPAILFSRIWPALGGVVIVTINLIQYATCAKAGVYVREVPR